MYSNVLSTVEDSNIKFIKEKYDIDIKIMFNSSWVARNKLDGVETKEKETPTEIDKGDNEND